MTLPYIPRAMTLIKPPIFFEFYDKTVPSLLPEEVKHRFLAEKEKRTPEIKIVPHENKKRHAKHVFFYSILFSSSKHP